MLKSVLMVSVLAIAGQELLTYRGGAEAGTPLEGEYTLAVTATGPPALTKQLMASNVILTIQDLRVRHKGKRVVSPAEGGASQVRIIFDSAHAEGKTAGKPFQFDFEGATAPATVEKDPLGQATWGLAMGPRHFILGPKGDYQLVNPNQDAQAEATGVILDAAIRLPDKPVNVGAKWSNEWTGTRQHRQNGGVFRYRQTATLAEIIAGAAPRARISVTTSARLDIPPDKNLQDQEVTAEGTGSILLDLKSGTVVSSETTGTITTDLKKAGMKLVFAMSAKRRIP